MWSYYVISDSQIHDKILTLTSYLSTCPPRFSWTSVGNFSQYFSRVYIFLRRSTLSCSYHHLNEFVRRFLSSTPLLRWFQPLDQCSDFKRDDKIRIIVAVSDSFCIPTDDRLDIIFFRIFIWVSPEKQTGLVGILWWRFQVMHKIHCLSEMGRYIFQG